MYGNNLHQGWLHLGKAADIAIILLLLSTGKFPPATAEAAKLIR